MPTEFPIKHSESDLLTELERDALAELANIGVSRAAASLRKMVGQQVLLSVPSVEVVSHKTAAAVMSEREGDDLIAVRQDFSGSFSGRALLIFPHSNSLVLVRAVVGDDVPHDDVQAMEEEALAETGNIILNGCLATIANMLQLSLEMSLPSVLRGSGPQLLEIEGPKRGEGLVLFLYINFSIKDLDIRGYIAVLMDLPALANLKRLLAEFIERVINDDTRKVE
jgi:chemotaxis protein CheC